MITHECSPEMWCPLCDHNVRSGGKRNHPNAPRRSQPVTARKPLPVCTNLHPEAVRVAGSTKTWRKCHGGFGSTAKGAEGLVAACPSPQQGVYRQGHECGERCPGYQAPQGNDLPATWGHDFESPSDPLLRATDLPRWREVPKPDVKPTRPRLVATLVIGDDAEAMHEATGPSQRRYAERTGADYVVIRGATQDPRAACAEKYRYRDYVPHYPDGTLCLDADVFVEPDAPDVFAATPLGHVGMVDVYPRMPSLERWFPGELAVLCRSQGIPQPARVEKKYWNTGVWVGRPGQADYWNPPTAPFPLAWTTEELYCRLNCARHGIPIHDLDPRFNWTWCEDRQLATVRDRRPWFWHFACLGNDREAGSEWTQPNRTWRLVLLRLLAATRTDR